MATFEIQGPDGKKYRVEGANAEGALAALKKSLGQQTAQPQQGGGMLDAIRDFNPVSQFGTGAYKGIAGTISGFSDASQKPRHPVAGRALPGAQNYVKTTIDPKQQMGPTYEDVTGFMQNTMGIPFAEPKTTSDRMLQATGAGAGGGMLFGAPGIAGGMIGGTASQAATELGAPPAVSTAIGIAAPLLTGRFGTPASKMKASQSLKAEADAAYRAADNAGLAVTDTGVSKIAGDVGVTAKSAGIDPTLHPKATAALARIEKAGAGGKPLSLDEIDTLRQIAGDAAKSIDAGERRVASLMIDKLDDALDNLGPGDVAAGSHREAVDAINRARERWNRFRRTEAIEEALTTARHRTAASGSGGNINNAVRQEIRKILDNKRKVRPFSAEERALMEKVVEGAPVENMLRLAGKLSPEGNGLMLMLQLGATAWEPTMAGVAIGGFASKRLADASTMRNVRKLEELVSGGKIPRGSLTPTQQQMIDALRRVGGATMGQTQPQ